MHNIDLRTPIEPVLELLYQRTNNTMKYSSRIGAGSRSAWSLHHEVVCHDIVCPEPLFEIQEIRWHTWTKQRSTIIGTKIRSVTPKPDLLFLKHDDVMGQPTVQDYIGSMGTKTNTEFLIQSKYGFILSPEAHMDLY
jgi:hypothetical protein